MREEFESECDYHEYLDRQQDRQDQKEADAESEYDNRE